MTPKQTLLARKRQAVEIRRQGGSLRLAAAESGLSQPTVIAAYRAWQERGWTGLEPKPGGRPIGSGKSIDPALWVQLRTDMLQGAPNQLGIDSPLWNSAAVALWLRAKKQPLPSQRTMHRYCRQLGLVGTDKVSALTAGWWKQRVYAQLRRRARDSSGLLLWLDECALPAALASDDGKRRGLLRAIDSRGSVNCLVWQERLRAPQLIDFADRLRTLHARPLLLLLGHDMWLRADSFSEWLAQSAPQLLSFRLPRLQGAGLARGPRPESPATNKDSLKSLTAAPASGFGPLLKQLVTVSSRNPGNYPGRHDQSTSKTMALDHLDRLEAESIHIFREVVAEAERPVMLYSIGKDSAVLLHLALKAFYPARLPFPLLHVDTTWKFQAMYAHRDQLVERLGLELISYTNPEGLAKGINPFTHGANVHTDIMKTQALKQALDLHRFDVAFGGARRDEEKSRAKERVLSFRNAQHRWDPKNQRPELWRLYNGRKLRGESLRAFPLSNWTEADIWQYIHREAIELVPLYLAAERPVVERDGALIMVDDERMQLRAGEVPVMRKVRFRTLGCYPLTGAVESTADTLEAVVAETLGAKTSERQGRVIDQDPTASMERKKQEGYF